MIPRRTADELRLTANLDGGVQQLFVEGPSDAVYMRIASSYPANTDIKSADYVDLNAVASTPFLGGNRAKLADLARKLEGKLKFNNVRILVDRDFEDWFSCLPQTELIVLSDYANLISAHASHDWLRATLLLAYGKEIDEDVWDWMVLTLREVFLLRYHLACQAPPVHLPDISPAITYKDGVLFFNLRDLVSRAMLVAERDPIVDYTILCIDQLKIWDVRDARFFIHSHDLFELVFIMLKRWRIIGGAASRDSIRAMLLGSIAHPRDIPDNIAGLIEWIANAE